MVEPDDQKLVHNMTYSKQHCVTVFNLFGAESFGGHPVTKLFCVVWISALIVRLGRRTRASEAVAWRHWLPTELRTHPAKRYKPVDIPWPLSEPFLDANQEGLELVVFEDQLTTVGKRLKEIGASTKSLLFARADAIFKPPMVIYSEGFTKFAFSSRKTRFQNALRSIVGPEQGWRLASVSNSSS